MGTILYAIIKTARPRQWLKSIALFTTVFFTGHILDFRSVGLSILGFFSFCFLASSNYIVNDILDAPSDRKHPFKRFRPVASGTLTIPAALGASVTFLIAGLIIANLLGQSFLALALLFVIIQYCYSLFLKKFSVIDILTITAGYFIRVYAGEAATGYHISIWLALAALSLALFLSIGKRRAELTLVQHQKDIVPTDTRSTLSHYSERLLDTYTAMFANSTFITYAFYSFLEKPSYDGLFFRGLQDFAPDVTGRKWMMVTIPFVLYGIMRYMQLIYEGQGESPEQILTRDYPLLVTVILWGISAFTVIYGIGG